MHDVGNIMERERRANLRRLRTDLWHIDGTEAGTQWLAACGEAIASIGGVAESCQVYTVDPGGEIPAVWYCSLTREGIWRLAGAEARQIVERVWEVGEPMCREGQSDDLKSARPPLEVGSIRLEMIYVPFAQGVLAWTCAELNSLTDQDVEFLEDVSEIISAYLYRMEDLRRMEVQTWRMRRSQRLEMVDQMAASAAHEINNVLTALLGKCELILADRDQPLTHGSIETVHQWGKRVQAIAANLLGFVRKQRTAPRTHFDLNALVRETLDLVSKPLNDDFIDVSADLEEDLPQIEGQAGQIQQVLVNLLKNSCDAILEHGERGEVEVRTKSREGHLVLVVEDSGPGIPAAMVEQIFKPFFTTKSDDKGTGLGLSICRDIVKDHGGRLWADLEASGGRLVVELPLGGGEVGSE